MRNEWEKKEVNLKDLVLWDENVRFDEGLSGANNKEIINFFFKNEYKMMDLVKFFTEQGEIPQDEKILVILENSKYKVLDGNRRVSVMNVLNDPQILVEDADRKKVEELKKKNGYEEPYKVVEVLVAPNEVKASKIIQRRHYNTGFLPHGSVEKDRILYKEGDLSVSDAFALQYFEEMLGCIDRDDRKNLRTGYSTIKRLFAQNSAEDIEKRLHVVFVNGDFKQVRGKSPLYKKAREKIIYQILKKELNTRTINTAIEAKKYLSNIFPKVEIPPNERPKIIEKKPKSAKKRESYGKIKFFNKKNGWEKIGGLYKQVEKLNEKSNDIVINICVGHLLECSIKVLLKNRRVNYERNDNLRKLFNKTKDLIQRENIKDKFTNTPGNINMFMLENLNFHEMWNQLKHNPEKTATSFDTKKIKASALEIVREIDNFLYYENTT